MQPFKWWGRFYNDSSDSILRRLKNFVRSFCHIVGHQVIQTCKKRKPVVSCPASMEKKTACCSLASCSAQPLITWLGHSTFLIQVAGINIITDPMFSSGFPVFSRQIPLPVAPAQLPRIDAVIVSHNHKDHLDMPSIHALVAHKPLLLVPMGNKQWLTKRGCEHVVEKMWWESEVLGNSIEPVTISFLPAIHWTSRGLFDINKSLWGSWLIEAAGCKIYFAGDSAYGDHFGVIAQRYGPIDIALMPIGPNEPRKFVSDSHVNAEEAVQAFIDLRARHFVPMHWGTFMRMGSERHDDPMEHLECAWQQRIQDLSGTELHVVACGEQRSF